VAGRSVREPGDFSAALSPWSVKVVYYSPVGRIEVGYCGRSVATKKPHRWLRSISDRQSGPMPGCRRVGCCTRSKWP